MKKIWKSFSFYLLTCAIAIGGEEIHTAAELRLGCERRENQRPFVIDATFTSHGKNGVLFLDSTGAMYTCVPANIRSQIAPMQNGDRIHLSGYLALGQDKRCYPHCTNATIIGRGESVKVPTISGADFTSGNFDFHVVQIQGVIKDAFIEEIDPGCIKILLNSNGYTLITSQDPGDHSLASIRDLIGAEILVTGFCDPDPFIRRNFSGRNLRPLKPMTILRHPNGGLFDSPLLTSISEKDPEAIARLGRYRIQGRVLAVWRAHDALILTRVDDRTIIIKARFASATFPKVGDNIEVCGFLGTDLYGYTLTRADWRYSSQHAELMEPKVTKTTMRTLFTDSHGHERFNPELLFRPITIQGLVRSVQTRGLTPQLTLESDGAIIQVEVGSSADLFPQDLNNCTIEISGYLIAEVENWSPNNYIPEIKELFISAESPRSIKVLAHPPWWTPTRLISLISILFALLLTILGWNRILGRKIERRSRELFNEQIAHVSSNLKTMERTRLAIELHDSLSQNLAGIALELQAVKGTLTDNLAFAAQHLDFADRSLASCREELRNCLKDLRSEALEIDDVNEAIRMTLAPYIEKVHCLIRFNVSRELISDNTMHALLRIVRELVQNAIRHGGASEVRVAGAIEEGKLLFSVSDNGIGFNVSEAPGISEGHFGLQGVRDRVNSFNGELTLKSTLNRGTKAVITINLPSTT